MLSLNEIMPEVSKMQNEVDGDRSIESMLLSINFDVTKLWLASRKEDKQELQKRVANLFVGSLILADLLGYKDVEAIISQRVEELKEQHALEMKGTS